MKKGLKWAYVVFYNLIGIPFAILGMLLAPIIIGFKLGVEAADEIFENISNETTDKNEAPK